MTRQRSSWTAIGFSAIATMAFAGVFAASGLTQDKHGDRGHGIQTSPVLTPAPRTPTRDTAPARSLTFAVWDLRHLSTQDADRRKQRQSPKPSVWRNTFGAERRTQRWRLRAPHNIDADVTILLGVAAIKDLRRMFEARHHHIVISRGALLNLGPSLTPDGRTAAKRFPAIVIRRRAGVRLTGQRHFLLPKLGSLASHWQSPGLATRLSIAGRRSIWLLTVRFPEACRNKGAGPAQPDCERSYLLREDIAGWLADRRKNGDTVLLAGVTAGAHLLEPGSAVQWAGDRDANADKCERGRPALGLVTSPGYAGRDNQLTLSAAAAPKQRPCIRVVELEFRQ